jgi:hypothetical protein
MKKSIIYLVLFIFFGQTFAKQVDQNTAKNVGRTFMTTSTSFKSAKGYTDLQLVYTANSNLKTSFSIKSGSTLPYFYVFNVIDAKGFVIVAGDDNATPILAYSDESGFDPQNIPQNAAKWLEGYKSQVRYIVENNIGSTDEIKNEWQKILKGGGSVKSSNSVNPLIQTKWSQSPYYNDLCPFDSSANQRTVTGCVATAMAQIMKFWNYPVNGTGFHSNKTTFGTLSANFGTTTYLWSSMPNTISISNNAIATIMYQIGISVDMNYGIASTGGSGAYVISAQSPVTHCSEYALKTYFGYKTTLSGIQRSNYGQTQWLNLLKAELDAGRPILYAGFGSGGGHCFVADGYDNNDFIHINWGWSGSYDGFFQINALNPSGVGTGGGNGGFNSGHQAVIGIEPPTGAPTLNLKLNNYVNPSANTINYGQSFTVTTNIVNSGSTTFNGDYCVAVFDNSYAFIDYVEIKTGNSLQGGYTYTNDLVFSNNGLYSMLPGIYHVGLFYRPTSGNWIQIANNGSYSNLVQLKVVYQNDIELNSPIKVTPGTSLTKGQSASVNLNIINNGTATFTGQYGVGLYNLDGTLAQTIYIYDESSGLPSHYTYVSPYLTFSNSSVTVNPGTYLLAVQHKPTSGSWQLTGSTNYINPIKVIVKEAPSLPDIYEPNNTVQQSYALPVVFSGNSSTVSTTGSNCHIGTDYDLYKINLPSGYDYSISARLHDSNNSGNGNTYTLDALFSYSTDGSTWSDAYDYMMSGNIIVKNGGLVNFFVAPYFSGETGTYLFDLSISRSSNTDVEKIKMEDLIRIYPNPAKNLITIDLSGLNKNINQIQLLNFYGQQVMLINSQQIYKVTNLPIGNLTNGTYFFHFMTSGEVLTKKIIIGK